MADDDDQQLADPPPDADTHEHVNVDDEGEPDPEFTRGERVRRRVKQALIGVGGAVGVGLVAWGVNRLVKGEPNGGVATGSHDRGAYPSPRVFANYSPDFAGPDGRPPAHWQMPSSHDAMNKRVQGSFEMGKRR